MSKPCDEASYLDRNVCCEPENKNRHRTLFERLQQEYERAEREDKYGNNL